MVNYFSVGRIFSFVRVIMKYITKEIFENIFEALN